MSVEVKIVNYTQIGPKSRKKDARGVNISHVMVGEKITFPGGVGWGIVSGMILYE